MTRVKRGPDRGPVGEAAQLARSLARTLNGAERALEDAVALEASVRKSAELAEELGRLSPTLRGIARDASDRADRQFLEFETAFREQCAARGWRLDGQWPTFHVERAVSVTIESQKRALAVAGKKLASSSPAALMTVLEPVVAGLIPKGFSAPAFLTELAASYDAVRRDARQVPIFDVYRELVMRSQADRFWRNATAGRFQGLSADQFRARLANVLEQNMVTTPDGRDLRLLPPLDAQDGVFVFQPAESRFGFVGRIEFTAAERWELS